MSSKTAPDATPAASSRPWSLAARLTLWFFLSSFTLVFAATVYLYWALATNLDREDDHFLTDRARGLLALVRERPTDQEAIGKQVIWAGAAHPESTIYLRVLKENGQVIAETPGMGDVLPSPVFSQTQTDQGEVLSGNNHRSGNGRWFRVVAVRASIDPARGSPLIVQAGMDRSHEEELLEDYRRNLWIVLGVSLIVTVHGVSRQKHGLFAIRRFA